ncbi:hypothetical protein BA060_10820 [Brucella sp. B13-0095]|nr:hypothetical protein BA060_10820 [Brucella sp. B13-0095]
MGHLNAWSEIAAPDLLQCHIGKDGPNRLLWSDQEAKAASIALHTKPAVKLPRAGIAMMRLMNYQDVSLHDTFLLTFICITI